MKTCKNSSQSRCSAFTMLELLVVIAIIGVLSALIIPAIGHMYEKGRMVQCVNNLRQLHTAAANYANDHDGALPFPATEDWLIINKDHESWGGHHTGWVDRYSDSDRRTYWWNKGGTNGLRCVHNGTLFKYVGQSFTKTAGSDHSTREYEAVYVCPTMLKLAAKKYGTGDEHSKVIRSYGMNASLQSSVEYPIKYFSINGPSRTMMFAEQGWKKQKGYEYALTSYDKSWDDKDLPKPKNGAPGDYICRKYRNFDGCIDWRGKENYEFDAGNSPEESIGEYHGGRGHAVFCDGHVERVKYTHTALICSGNWENRQPIDMSGISLKDW